VIRDGLRRLKANLLYAVVIALIVGLGFGQIADAGAKAMLRAAVVPVLFVMIYPMMITIDLQEIINVRKHARVVGLSLLINFVIAPLVAVGLTRLFFAGRVEYAIGLYFIALVPTSGMTAAWTGLAGGDLEAALVAMAVNLLTAVLVLPAYLSVLVPASVGFDPTALYRQLALIVAVPMVAGTLTRRGLFWRYGEHGFTRLKPMFGGFSSLGVIVIVFIAMTLRSTQILRDPLASVSVIVPLLAFYLTVVLVASGLGRLFVTPERAIALVYATSMRNLSIALAIVVAAEAIPNAAVLPIALSYAIQPPLGAAFVHYRRDVVAEGRSLREALRRFVSGSG